MTFVHDDEVEELALELRVVFLAVRPNELLIEGKVYLVGGIELAASHLRHGVAERLEVLHHSLIDEDVAVRDEKRMFHEASLAQTVDDLERSVGLARTRGHYKQYTFLTAHDGLDGTAHGDALVVARRLLLNRVIVKGRGKGVGLLFVETLGRAETCPEFVRAGEIRKGNFLFSTSNEVMFKKRIAVCRIGKRHVEHFGILDCLLKAFSN